MSRQMTLHETAAAWALKGDDLREDERARRDAWLADPLHSAAYDAACRACDLAGAHAAAPEMMAMREAALAARSGRPVVAWRVVAGAAAAIALMAVSVSTLVVLNPPTPDAVVTAAPDPNTTTYQTVVGERSTFALPDGSSVTLDTDSALTVAYTTEERGIHLTRGQALFDVAKNQSVPFQVYAGDRRITAVGTLFNVRLDGGNVKVALIEGVIRVTRSAKPSAPAQQVTLKAGEVLETAPQLAAAVVRPADAVRASSWKEGVVVFDDTKLSDAVAEINRYTTRPIAIADPSLGAYRVSGVFKTGDPARFADAMSEVFPIAVERMPDGAAALRRRD